MKALVVVSIVLVMLTGAVSTGVAGLAVVTGAGSLLPVGGGFLLGSGGATGGQTGPGAVPPSVADLTVTIEADAGGVPDPRQDAAIWALSKVGTRYVWGGESDAGFDCSGLVQAAFASAGVSVPRVAQDQFDAGPVVAGVSGVVVGDLVFFGGGPADVTHVGIVVASGQMVDAPHTGADVRVEAFPAAVGDSWGSDVYVGATSPG